RMLAFHGVVPEVITLFYSSLGVIVIGNGCFKPNTTNLLSRSYIGSNDPRMDNGYTWFYLSINIGSISAILIVPQVAERYGYAQAFGLCSLGLFIGIANFLRRWNLFSGLGSDPDFDPLHYVFKVGIVLSLIALSFLFGVSLSYVTIAKYFFNFVVLCVM